MSNYTDILKEGRATTPVSTALDSRQVKNNTGGYVYKTSDREAFTRFMILGTTSNTYYQSAKDLTREALPVLDRVLKSDPDWMLQEILAISEAGRSPKQDAGIFALAYMTLSDDPNVRSKAYDAIPRVCRTGSTYLQFVSEVESLRTMFNKGWGSGLSRGVRNWLYKQDASQLAYQAAKYGSREGWSMHDVLRMTKPSKGGEARRSTFGWIAGNDYDREALPKILQGVNVVREATTVDEVVKAITDYKLTREMVPAAWLKEPKVWEALVPGMPMGALLRNLGTLSARGLLNEGSDYSRLVQSKFANAEAIREARLHPYNIALAMKTYAQGHGTRGSQSWNVNKRIVGALEDAIDLSFGLVEPTGLRYEIALDVSGSMSGWGDRSQPITPREATILMSMPLYRTEEQCGLYGFSSTYMDLTKKIGIKDSYRSALSAVNNLPFSSTNIGLTIETALKARRPVDVFIVMTDNEVNGGYHVAGLLQQYRETMGINAKLIVCGFTATQFTVGDPNDGGTLNIAGLDSALPSIVREFSLM